ncbi:MAG: hypothetical protein ACRDPM_05840 [Solirubrobacteraceae bacterium]
MPGVIDAKPGTVGWRALVVMGVLLLMPAAAQARRIYVNIELSQESSASLPAGEQWQSTATMSAYYRTTSQALSSGDGTLQLTPTATLGTFTANLSNPLPGVPLNCTWRGAPGGGHPLAQLQDGTPFAHALSIQWPGSPGMWSQTLSRSSTGKCLPAFVDIPLQGEVKWALGSARGTGGGNHFLFAAAPRNTAVERGAWSASIADMTMTSLLTRSDGASYAVAAQGFLIESTVPYARRKDVLPVPSIFTAGMLSTPLSSQALRRLALQVVPKGIPLGCVAGQRRRRRERCP